MRIVFGLHLDGLNPAAPRNAAGEITLGPSGLLQVLETQLGLPTPSVHPSEAPFSYLQCLREASTPDRFFHRSLNVDPVNVARTLLDWRAQWYEAGWDGTFRGDAPSRLVDLAAVEAIAVQRVSPTAGQRLQRVARSLAERRTQIEQVELHTPFEDLPHVWQRVLSVLPWFPAPGLELAAAGLPGSDLARVQSRLLSMSDRDDDNGAEPQTLQGDGSLVLVKSGSKDLSADAIAEYVLETGGISGTLLVAEIDGIVLDNALERAGLPRCGFRHYTRFRSATQVLKLALALVWKPVDPHRLLQFLLHPSGPLPRWIRWRMADSVAASPGIGGPTWIRCIERIAQTLRDGDEAEEYEVERLQSEIAFWLEAERYDADVGAPLATLLERTGRVSMWASKQSNTVENESEAAMFAAAHAQAEALLTELEGLKESGVRRISRLELQRRIDEVTTGAPDPSTYEEAGRARATTEPVAVTGLWPTVIWWNLARESTAVSYPWSRHELHALRASGVRLPEVDDIVRRRSREWLRPLCSATERLVLVAHHDERGMHPLWTRIDSLFDGLTTVEIEPVLLDGGATLQPLGVRTRELPLRHLRAPRRWWSLPPEYPVAQREVESYSSLSKLCDHPHEWVLEYAARLRAGRAAAVMDGSRLWGNLGHRLFEEFFRTHADWPTLPDDAVLAWIRSVLPGIVEREGAVLLGHGHGVDRQRVAATLERALVRLLAHLRSAGVIEATAEASGEAPFEGRRLTGTIDLTLTYDNGQRAVLDVKWAGENRRGDLLTKNRALQLATYAYLQKSRDESDAWPAGAFFILATGNVLAANQADFPDAVVHAPEDGSGTPNLWDRLRVTWEWRWDQLGQGRIEVVTDLTEPDERSRPPDEGLRPVSGGDRYDDYLRLTGWEVSR
ncbi:MAG: PD-(D/E)XK nuclease family protein [Gammaproteobacteria bacterium]|nr:PD-(D/E)XK nuclease family protein [Gammaproteobacteria bacterium]MXY04763.1 PD-(D/E)XK nuclease family protein [Gammaproteobacteria bacterium]MYG12545.1 PD-(D/E)XK nuclease family protein [Gammaproteobacteria bacterium]MYK27576.1 PD-(D/E)XK nuclease family protein [Gammaproteobacteria bacterium]